MIRTGLTKEHIVDFLRRGYRGFIWGTTYDVMRNWLLHFNDLEVARFIAIGE
jgi:hypothetical protein